MIQHSETRDGVTHTAQTRVYEGDPGYQAIEDYFRNHPDIYVTEMGRTDIPGGAGPLPAPAVQ